MSLTPDELSRLRPLLTHGAFENYLLMIGQLAAGATEFSASDVRLLLTYSVPNMLVAAEEQGYERGLGRGDLDETPAAVPDYPRSAMCANTQCSETCVLDDGLAPVARGWTLYNYVPPVGVDRTAYTAYFCPLHSATARLL